MERTPDRPGKLWLTKHWVVSKRGDPLGRAVRRMSAAQDGPKVAVEIAFRPFRLESYLRASTGLIYSHMQDVTIVANAGNIARDGR